MPARKQTIHSKEMDSIADKLAGILIAQLECLGHENKKSEKVEKPVDYKYCASDDSDR